MSLSSHTRVAVLRGGPSPEYDVSLKTGATVLKNLPEHYTGIDVLIDRAGVWHIGGLPKSPEKVLMQTDVVFNALHGSYGEDGTVQQILQSHAIPFTGSGAFASSVTMNKMLAKQVYTRHGIKTPVHEIVRRDEDVRGSSAEKKDGLAKRVADIFKTFLMPAVVKPASAGSSSAVFSSGVAVVHTASELAEAIERAFAHSDTVIVEEYIAGKEASCGVVENFRGDTLHALMPVEIVKDGAISVQEICPGNFSPAEKIALTDLATRAHTALGLRHYSRSDFIVTPRRGVYILETNSLPGLTEQSLLPKALNAGGTNMSQFLDHVIGLAMVG